MKKRPEAIPWEQVKKELFRDPKVKKAYEDLQPEFAIIQALIDARVKKKISQEDLAKRMGTGQAVISRLENANASPSLSLIKRLANALNLKVELKFTPR
ncbi:helix-turn-helix transcriptional regulator [Candidatus Daviesbacteria bacterium]|nr:helix-turn-helix transcriptional regulator [Candidatus Daviesbacteria bacterium]